MNSIDTLNDTEFTKYSLFNNEHKGHQGIIELSQRYPAGFGVISLVSCSVCREIKDITDYDCW